LFLLRRVRVGVEGDVRVDTTFAVDVGVYVALLLFLFLSQFGHCYPLLAPSALLLPAFAVVYVLESGP
jgi:hypothetical protein